MIVQAQPNIDGALINKHSLISVVIAAKLCTRAPQTLHSYLHVLIAAELY